MKLIILMLIVLACIIIFILAKSFHEINTITTKAYAIPIPKLKSDKNIVFFSDFHSVAKKGYIDKLVNEIKKANPQCVVIGGDMIVGKKGANNKPAIELLEKLAKEFKIYYVYGNHESRMFERKIQDEDGYFEFLTSQTNVEILNNKSTKIQLDNVSLNLTGLEFSDVYYKKGKSQRPKITEIEDKLLKTEHYSIVVCHKPEFFEVISQTEADLVLAGHNHGGIVRFPFIGGIVSTSYRLFPRYSYGLYKKNNCKMILSSGIGTHTIHFRLFNPPEIVNICFCRKK